MASLPKCNKTWADATYARPGLAYRVATLLYQHYIKICLNLYRRHDGGKGHTPLSCLSSHIIGYRNKHHTAYVGMLYELVTLG